MDNNQLTIQLPAIDTNSHKYKFTSDGMRSITSRDSPYVPAFFKESDGTYRPVMDGVDNIDEYEPYATNPRIQNIQTGYYTYPTLQHTNITRKNYNRPVYGINMSNEYAALPMNIYAWSKYVAEQYIIQNGGIALRYFNVYGPFEEHKGAMASVAYQMYMKNLNGEKIKLFPDKPKRDFVHVDDVARANLFAFTHYNDLYGKVYDVGTGTPHEFEKIMELLKIEYTYHDKSVIPEGYQFYTSSDPYKWMPSWQPIYDLENGIDHYKAYLHRELASGNYKRYLREQYKYGG